MGLDEGIAFAALIMAGQPGKMMHDIQVDLPDPRERDDPKVKANRADLMQIFHDAAHTPQESPAELVITTI